MSRKSEKEGKKNGKKTIIILIILIILLMIIGAYYFVFNHNFNNVLALIKKQDDVIEDTIAEEVEEEIEEDVEIVDIVDVESKTRPFALAVNNTPVAVKVQQGLNKAFLIYELPTEGNTSRLLAFFKDIDDLTVGTIRSARHNFVDYALESNAILVVYGWSHYAEYDMLNKKPIDYVQGLFDSSAFWRNNPEKLASEHTAYTSIAKIRECAKTKKFNLEANSSESTILLNYNVDEIDINEKEGAEIANTITIPYGIGFKTEFKYNEETKEYDRYENGAANIDHETKEQFTTKNIIVQKIKYSVCDDNYYWDLSTIGTGDGYYITNGYAVPIKWNKSSRNAKTKYTYEDGTEVEVSDGRTYIEVQTTSQKLTIE